MLMIEMMIRAAVMSEAVYRLVFVGSRASAGGSPGLVVAGGLPQPWFGRIGSNSNRETGFA